MSWISVDTKPPLLTPISQYSIDLLMTDGAQVHKGYYWNVRGEWRGETGSKIKAIGWMRLPLP